MNLIGLLIALVVVAILVVATKYLVDYLEFPPPARLIALLIVGLIALVFILNQFGAVGSRVVVW